MEKRKQIGFFKHKLAFAFLLLQQFGFNPLFFIRSLGGVPQYLLNLRRYRAILQGLGRSKKSYASSSCFGRYYPILSEFKSQAGTASGHYFHQDLYFAKRIFLEKPQSHLDVGSRIDGFIAHLLSFGQKVMLGDVRPLEIDDPNIQFVQLDISLPESGSFGRQYRSISSLHVIEHIGLGRYGDSVDPFGHLKAVKHLSSLLAPGGLLYLSFPISSKSRIEYNAHRVISLAESVEIFNQNNLVVKDFAYVDDWGGLVLPMKNSSISDIDLENSYGLQYGCGLWTLSK